MSGPVVFGIGDEILWAGGAASLSNGKVALLSASAPTKDEAHASALLSAAGPPIGGSGALLLRGVHGEDHICLEAAPAHHTGSIIWVGGNGRAGDIVVLPASATTRDGNQAVIHINGTTGDILFQ